MEIKQADKKNNVKGSCIYCGNNPVPHSFFWFNESLNILLTPLRQRILYNGFSRFLKNKRLDLKLGWFFISLGEALKIISRQDDVSKCKVRRAQVIWEEAVKRGIKMQELLLFGFPIDVYIAEFKNKKSDAKKIFFSGLPRPEGYMNKWLDLMDDKFLFKQKLISKKIPVPAGGAATNFSQALEIFNKIEKPVIVKPRSGSRGRHSTTYIYSEQQLKLAFKIAKQLCFWVIVEEQLMGSVYRATVINFELAGVLRGDCPKVLGDGISSIEELINIKNKQQHNGVKNIAIDNSTKVFLARQNLTLNSIIKKGQEINLSEKIGVNYGGSSSEDFSVCHEDNKKLFVEAAKVLGDPLVGFDFIIPDITKPWTGQKCGFIEVNSLPFINLHHDPLFGEPQNVAAKVWGMIAK